MTRPSREVAREISPCGFLHECDNTNDEQPEFRCAWCKLADEIAAALVAERREALEEAAGCVGDWWIINGGPNVCELHGLVEMIRDLAAKEEKP
jgi:hypothetical protein